MLPIIDFTLQRLAENWSLLFMRLNFILLILLALTAVYCKKEKQPESEPEPKPLADFAVIFGSWRLYETEFVQGDSLIRRTASGEDAQTIRFRYDGIMLNEFGEQECCHPDSYLLNGVSLKVVTVGSPPPIQSQCHLVDCMGCPEYKLIQSADSLVVEYCGGYKKKYVRPR